MAKAAKYYAVRNGIVPGIYTSWAEAEQNIKGFSGAEYKSFKTEAEATAYMNGEKQKEIELPSHAYAFVDGSFNAKTSVYGYGGFLVLPEDENGNRREIMLQGAGEDPDMAAMHNVAGEILGAAFAAETALDEGQKELTIFHDYEGISKWVAGEWQTKKPGTIRYKEEMDAIQKAGLVIHFVHTKGHSGVPGNERADKLAKAIVGIG